MISPRGLRRSGEVEGVRQAMGNIAIGGALTELDVISRKNLVPLLSEAIKRYVIA